MGILDLARAGLDGIKKKPQMSHPYAAADYLNILSQIRGEPDQKPLWQNGVIVSGIKLAGRVFPEAPCYVESEQADATWDPVANHACTMLLRRPNPAYSGRLLWSATLASLILDDNAYWLKIRSGSGWPVQLWYIPHFLVTPERKNAGDYVTSYRLDSQGGPINVDPSEVVHFRDGIDPDNTMRGLAKFAAMAEDVLTDNQAAAFSYHILRNAGVPSFAIYPDVDGPINPESAKELKSYVKQVASGKFAGDLLAPTHRIKFEKLAFSPEEMALDKIRRWPTDRICSAMGMNAMVLGLPSETRTFSNFKEAREAFAEEWVVPTQSLLADEIGMQLLPDFGAIPGSERLAFDLSNVRILQEDRNAASKRATEQWKAKGITLAEYRADIGKTKAIPGADNIWYEGPPEPDTKPADEPKP